MMKDKELIKNALVKYISSEFSENSIIYTKSNTEYRKERVLEEIINDTKEGIKLQQNIVDLTINLLLRNKEKL